MRAHALFGHTFGLGEMSSPSMLMFLIDSLIDSTLVR